MRGPIRRTAGRATVTERLADITERIDNMRQLRAVVSAMRGIAAGRAQQSRALIAGIDAYTAGISQAIGEALRFLPAPARAEAREPRRGLLLFCAEQGFAGGFSDRVLEAAGLGRAQRDVPVRLMIVGTRGAALAAERGFAVAWTMAMANQIRQVPDTANRTADALYAAIAKGEIAAVDVLYSRMQADRSVRVERIALLPLALEGFRSLAAAIPPLTTLAPQLLLAQLTEEYIYARLCEAAMHSFAAENEARMQAMTQARKNVDKTLVSLVQREHHVRQEEVTAEILELAAGVEAQQGGAR
jgi:F-type H+-transporting ATPase subunit gamma